MIINIKGKDYTVIVNKKDNKNTYIRINDNLEIEVSASKYMNNKMISDLINHNLIKVEKMILRKESKKVADFDVYLLSKKFRVVIISNINKPEIDGEFIYGKSLIEINKYVDKINFDYFSKLLKECYDIFEENFLFPNLKVRKMKSRWGVCNRLTKTVTLNHSLANYSEEIIKYVIIHELAHFVHFNHSSSFWSLVSKYCPNYKKIRKELKG